MLERLNVFRQFEEKMEKLKLSLSKQRNKMLKIKSEMLKIKKKSENNQARKIFRENFREFPESQQSQRSSGFRKFPGVPEKFFENFPLPG